MRDIVRKVINEETDEDRLLNYFKKKWDKEKNSGQTPVFNGDEIKKLGLRSYYHIIRLGFIDYFNKNIGDVYRVALDDLTNNTFTTDDIKKLNIGVGGYDFKFEIYDIIVKDIPKDGSIGTIKPYVKIIEGTVTTADGEEYDLTDYDNTNLDSWWEIENEVDELISYFIEVKLLTYGITIDSLGLDVQMYNKDKSINESVDDKMKDQIANKFIDS